MRKVFTFGETVYDVIFKNGKINSAKAGGAMLNSSVSLGRLGIDVNFISEIGDDNIGELIIQFLISNHVSVDYIYRFNQGKTPLAIAFLDDQQKASYSFYKIYPEKRLQQPLPKVTANDIVLFGSFFSLSPEIREPMISFVRKAKDSGAIIIYDPNIRKSHQNEIREFHKLIIENISLADIIRGSDEDFEAIFDVNNAKEAFGKIIGHGCEFLVYTSGSANVYLHTNSFTKISSVPVISPRSTIGAGDNFNAGIIFSLIRLGIFKKDLYKPDSLQCTEILKSGIALSQEVCKSYDNYISTAFAKRFLKHNVE